ncbi:MAG: aspartyl protease family protein [Planctomycetota bacterium]
MTTLKKNRKLNRMTTLGIILVIAGAIAIIAGRGGFGVDHRLLSAKEKATLNAQVQPGLVWPEIQRPGNIEIDGTVVSIPMSHYPNYFVFPTIDGIKRRFLVDTGAWNCMLDPYVAIQHNVPIVPGITPSSWSLSGTTASVAGIIPHIQLGDIAIKDTPVIISEASSGFKICWIRVGRLDGIFGNSFFIAFVATFDARNKILTLRLPSGFDPSRDLPNIIDTIPFKINDQGHIELTARICGQDRQAILDFGAQSAIVLPLEWAQELKIPLNGSEKITGHGGKVFAPTGGPVVVEIGKARAELSVVCPAVSYPAGCKRTAIISDTFFDIYRLTIDFPKRLLYIENRDK